MKKITKKNNIQRDGNIILNIKGGICLDTKKIESKKKYSRKNKQTKDDFGISK